ncbi:MAG: hypothetical protein ABR529_06810 [Actinomycetota bacterium]
MRPGRPSTVPVAAVPTATDRLARTPASSEGDEDFEAFLQRVQNFRCRSKGKPATSVDMSCNTRTLGQNFGPDNEIAVAVDPKDPRHLVAGSNDYYYRFDNATGEVLVTVPTGFFTSFDGGRHWIDGQVPRGEGNNAGDPSPAFDAKHGVVLMAGLDFTSSPDRSIITDGNVAVSRSTDGGRKWKPAVVVMEGAGPDTSESQVFFDKEWLTVDNNPRSPHYGRAYVTATRFLGGPIYKESPIFLTYSDDGGRTWSKPKEISGSHPTCSYQETGSGTDCDEDQFSIPEIASDGTLYVHYLNGQNEAEWEVPFEFDSQIMVRRSKDGGKTFSRPVPVVQLEDGASDMPWSVIVRQTIWGHQLRWASAGNISVDPNDPKDVTIVFSDRGTPNPNATAECLAEIPGEAPDYDPCDAGPGAEVSIYAVRSTDGGATWSERSEIDGTRNHSWFPWADHGPNGKLVVSWDEDVSPPLSDAFNHVLWVQGRGKEILRPNTSEDRTPTEQIDISLTHWTGQYVPEEAWPRICGPEGYSDPPVEDAEGKDCNAFHGDYTGLAVGRDGSINVTWTGLNRWATSKQLDPYTGELHDGYAQDAMFARR